MPKFRLSLLTFFILCSSAFPALASDCTAPVLLYRVSGSAPNKQFATSVAEVGDLNGDGRSDFVVGAPNTSPNGISAAGAAYVYSGIDGTFLYQINGTASADYLGQSVAGLGDINTDGKPDFIIRASTYASIYSGLDSVSISKISLPAAASPLETGFAATGDVNGDGTTDLIIGVSNVSSVFVYSGTGDSLLYQINGSSGDLFGSSVSTISDVNDDGNADFIVGAPCADTVPAYACNGTVYVYSGIDGTLLRQVDGTNSRDYLGLSASGIGDLDKDGKNDFIAGAPFLSNTSPWESPRPSYCRVYSSMTGDLLLEKSNIPTSRFGWSVKGLPDVNGDGSSDIMVSAPGEQDIYWDQSTPIGVVYVYSGSDGTLIYQVKSPFSYDFFGTSISGLGDLDGNGKTDILIGALENHPAFGYTDSGAVYVFVSKTVPKGDLDFDSTLTIADVTSLLNVVFVDNSLAISPCTADLNCDGAFSPADVTLLLKRVFLQTPLPCL